MWNIFSRIQRESTSTTRSSRIVITFVVLAIVHAFILALLQGEALETSRHGVNVLQAIQEAPKFSIIVGAVSSGSQSTSASSSYYAAATTSTAGASSTTSSQPQTSSTKSSSVPLVTSSSSSPRFVSSPATTSSSPSTTTTTAVKSSSSSFSASPPAVTTTSAENLLQPVLGFLFASTVPALLTPAPTKAKGVDSDSNDSRRFAFVKRKQTPSEEIAPNPQPLYLVASVKDAKGNSLAVTEECAEALLLPGVQIQRMESMSFTFIFYHLWLLLLTLAGVYYESAPHVLAAMLAHLLAFAYAVFQTTLTKASHRQFHDAVVQNACGSNAILPQFWETTLRFQIAIVVLQAVGSIALGIVAWRLASVFQWQTFKKIGADRRIARSHAIALVFEIFLHISAFFIVAFQGIWLHELATYPWPASFYKHWSELSTSYEILLGVLTGLVVPWLIVGWFAFRRENKWLVVSFLIGDLLFLGHSLFLVTQNIYMETQSSFRFLTFLGSVAATAATGTFLLGILRVLNFKRNVSEGLAITWVTPFPKDEAPYDLEKGFSGPRSATYSTMSSSRNTLADIKTVVIQPTPITINLQRSTSSRSLQPSISRKPSTRKAPPQQIRVEALAPGRIAIAVSDSDEAVMAPTVPQALQGHAQAKETIVARGSRGTFGSDHVEKSRWSGTTEATSNAPPTSSLATSRPTKSVVKETSRWSFSTTTTQTESSVGGQTPAVGHKGRGSFGALPEVPKR